ncbi:DUF937 domain-containing protein [Mycobacterium sp.]|uniref:DUF937 domain-containing protein n=1 Tax=Mycobacterium sp. TaxID=1785 RepID=UPI003A862F2D
MAELADLFAQIPTADIAAKLGADEGEVGQTIQTLVPVLLSGLQENSQDSDFASTIATAAAGQAAKGLLDAGGLGNLDEAFGLEAVSTLFGGKDTDQVASALAGGGVGSAVLVKQLLPVVLPIVLAYVGKHLAGNAAPAGAGVSQQSASGGALGEVLGSILGGGGNNNALGGILGSVLGGNKGGALGSILGGLLGGKK